jgi:fumarate hydratase class II
LYFKVSGLLRFLPFGRVRTMEKFRRERDSLGEVNVPADRYWGAQTERSIHNFQVGSEVMPIEIIRAFALIKKGAAQVNQELGLLSKEKGTLIEEASDEILSGRLDSHFPLVVWQTGSGTQTNMNVNEVISNWCIQKVGGTLGSKKPIHPNDDVNASQSSNDTFPTAMHIATVMLTKSKLLPALTTFYRGLQKKAHEYRDLIKIGRTHLMDAAPMTLGQEFSGYAAQLEQAILAIERSVDPLYDLALGGTAVGTGLNAPPKFGVKVAEKIEALTGLAFRTAPNKFAALATHDALVGFSGALRQTAIAFMKIANDIRWLGSGPRCGLSELFLPENEPGSSIMPGKVNPTQCESMTMIAVEVMGNDAAVAIAGSLGQLELNVFKPVIIYNVLRSMHLLADAALNFHDKCLIGIRPNEKKIAQYVENSLMLATALNRVIGYDKAAQVVKKAAHEDISLKEAALQLQFLTAEEFDAAIDLKKMVHPEKGE